MIKLLAFFLTLSSVYAQTILPLELRDKGQLSSTGGGNGGHPIEERVVTVLREIKLFFRDLDNQKEFPEINFMTFESTLESLSVYAVREELFDVNSNRRCLINKNSVIIINENCWNSFLGQNQDHYAILFHEILGELGIETAGDFVPSSYPVSSRINKFVLRINEFALVNVNKFKEVGGLALNCSTFGDSLRMKHTKTLFVIQMNKDKKLKIHTRDFSPKMFNIWFDNLLRKKSSQFDTTLNDYRKTIANSNIDLLSRNKENVEAFYNESTKKLHIPFNLWKSKTSHFEIPLSNILILSSAKMNSITVERHMKNGEVKALRCEPLILNSFSKANNFHPHALEIEYGFAKVDMDYIHSIQNYFINL